MDRKFLVVSREDMEIRDWHYLDYIIVSGDAYVDHPSFGAALIGRLLESKGYRVGIIAQPDWRSKEAFEVIGRPRYAFLITAGNLDSMVSNYTASKRKRNSDEYSPGGKAGLRPDRAAIVYANRVREAFPDVPVILGGIEASLRRLAHYDYWDDRVRRSLIVDGAADLLIYGMGELQILEVARRLKKGEGLDRTRDIQGTVFTTKELPVEGMPFSAQKLPSFEEVTKSKRKYADAFKAQYLNQNTHSGRALIQQHEALYVVQTPPARPLTQEEMDEIYDLPFTRTFHPMYKKAGGVPALQEVEFSVTSHRGCFGGCAFCALNFHQGRIIQARSEESILKEVRNMTESPNFKGIVHDIGGPTANFRKPACKGKGCTDRLCLHPKQCKNLQVNHDEYIKLLRKARKVPGVKKVFVRSGVRFDYLMADPKKRELVKELCEHHISGLLKVAPEHVAEDVTTLMRKPPKRVFEGFRNLFYKTNEALGKKQYLVPYFITSHPGTTLKDAVELAEYIRDLGHNPEQVQDFTPTPGSLATAMYYTGMDPITGKKVYVPKSEEERKLQRALLQYRKPQNHELVRKALRITGREDLIGYGPKTLVPPSKDDQSGQAAKKEGRDNRRNTRDTGSRRKSSGPDNRSGSHSQKKRRGPSSDRRASGTGSQKMTKGKDTRKLVKR